MPRYTYTGDEPQTYPQYLDVGGEVPRVLVAEPGQTYDIAQVEGFTVPGEAADDGSHGMVETKLAMPPDDRWSEPKAPAKSKFAKGGGVNSGADQASEES